ncbi:MAG: hypothetical protein QOD65_75, partial [Gaiellales bacterium]|nr:hypothetical protein [Gaiellales bacterium]
MLRRVSVPMSCRIALALGLSVLAGVETPGALPAARVPSARLAAYGISVTLSPGWHGRILRAYGEPVLQVANFRLPVSTGASGSAAIQQMRSTKDVFVLLSEVGNRPGTSGFVPTALPLLVTGEAVAPRFPGIPRDRGVLVRRFAIEGRSFSLQVYFSDRPVHASQRRAANSLLASLRVQQLVPEATWRRLHRLLQLPNVKRGTRCPRAASGRAAPATYFTLGHGPAYPVFGTPNGIAQITTNERRGRVYWHKTLWAVSAAYRGPVLVRGRRIDGNGAVQFSPGGTSP